MRGSNAAQATVRAPPWLPPVAPTRCVQEDLPEEQLLRLALQGVVQAADDVPMLGISADLAGVL
jgi:hypothetical protein